MSTGKVVSGVLAGAAVGAILGVLFAPASGAATRRIIYRKSEDGMDTMKEKFNEFVENVSHRFESAKEEVTEMVDKGKEDMKNQNFTKN